MAKIANVRKNTSDYQSSGALRLSCPLCNRKHPLDREIRFEHWRNRHSKLQGLRVSYAAWVLCLERNQFLSLKIKHAYLEEELIGTKLCNPRRWTLDTLEQVSLSKQSNVLVTDAGLDKIPYQMALSLFSKEQIELSYNNLRNCEINCDLSSEVVIVTAKAVIGEYRWFKILSLLLDPIEVHYFYKYEKEAILLGVVLREYLAQKDILILNDNKQAINEVKQEIANIVWTKRGGVQKAHFLGLQDATFIVFPTNV